MEMMSNDEYSLCGSRPLLYNMLFYNIELYYGCPAIVAPN